MDPSGTVALLGNVGHPDCPPHATEAEYLRAYQKNGVAVGSFLESDPDHWKKLIDTVAAGEYSFVHWTSTHSFRQRLDDRLPRRLAQACETAGIPLVGVHLDRFWGIRERERSIPSDPYFKYTTIVLTADGGSDERWDDAGIRHRWLLPGVSERWCKKGKVRPEFETEIAFVGSWQRYHRESRHRFELVSHLARRYGKRVMFMPGRGQPALRGQDLLDFYTSAKLVVGDSFAPTAAARRQPPPRYGSDRTPETLGRGGILLHPAVEGWNGAGDPFDTPATLTWRAWDWRGLDAQIAEALSWGDKERDERRAAARKHIKAHHTYEVRVKQIFEILAEEGLL